MLIDPWNLQQFDLAFISACISEPQFVYHAAMVVLSIIGLHSPGFMPCISWTLCFEIAFYKVLFPVSR